MISAFRDDRFEPISKTEVPHLSVGVSLLVNFTKIDDPLEWEVGKHGIEIDFTINGREYGSTFLPEVASE
jgi:AMMECR1 domain-containing protein